MAITTASILSQAKVTLLDETNVRWTDDELLNYLNAGQTEIVMLKPDAYSKNHELPCSAGTKQTLPSDAVLLLDVVRNITDTTSDPSTAGKVITKVMRADLDVTRPDWHNETQTAEAEHYVFDERDPTHFYVTPPSSAAVNHAYEVVYSAAPADATLVGNITLADVYRTPIYYYIMFRAHSKETQASSPEKSNQYYKLFVTAVAGKQTAEQQGV